MECLDVIYARRSVRGYTGEPVARETLKRLLDAAVQAPTGMNAQPWAFGVIEGAERLRALSDRGKALLLSQLDRMPMFERYRDMLADPNFNLCYHAPALVIIFKKPDGATADADCAMAAQNLMLAACDQGLGTCWIGFLGFLLNTPEVKRELGVPEDYTAVAPLVVGYPAAPAAPVEKAAPAVLFWQ